MLRAKCYGYWILVFDMPDFWPWYLFYCKSWQHYFYSEIIQNFSIKKDIQLFLHNVASKKQKLYMGKLNNLRWPLNIVINVKSKACALNHCEFCNICSIFILWFVLVCCWTNQCGNRSALQISSRMSKKVYTIKGYFTQEHFTARIELYPWISTLFCPNTCIAYIQYMGFLYHY